MEQEIHPHLTLECRKKSLNCDQQSVLVKPTKSKTCRKIGSDFLTILIIVYHMVQWIKVNQSQGQSYQDEDY